MKMTRQTMLAIALANTLASGSAFATNGYFSDGTGAKNRGMGGAGTALAQEAGSVVLNPAAAVNMDPRMDIGAGLFSPDPRGYTISGNDCSAGLPAPCGGGTLDGTQESRKTGFLIPFFGITDSIDNESSWAFTVTALGGMNTDFKNNPFQPFSPAPLGPMGIDLKQVSFGGTYAQKINDKLSVGATLSLIVQQFEAKGLGAFAGLSADNTKLTNNGVSNSTGIGLNLGVSYDLSKDMTIAFAYSPKADMSEFDDYAGLFAEGGDFDIPSNYALGFSWQFSKDMLFSTDLRRINYTDVASVSNDAQRLTDLAVGCSGGVTNDPTMCLGGANGAGFGWDDMTIIKFGVAWAMDSDTTLRAGWNHGSSPIESEDAVINIIAPAVVEDHLTLGMTMALSSTSEITFDFIHSFANDVTGDVPMAFGSFGAGPAPIPGSAGTATIEMEQNFIEVQYGKRF